MLLVALLSGVKLSCYLGRVQSGRKGEYHCPYFETRNPTRALPEHVFQALVLPCLAYTCLHISCVGASAWTYLPRKVTNTFPAFIYTVPVDIILNIHFYITYSRDPQIRITHKIGSTCLRRVVGIEMDV
ncbi:hypothetical protein B0T26DRAFT_117804 [Lasiosphaeria miniovina]|uniref:Uncharacterized protein n=1 Tax=Lasiosphaeria miniovina TaxID=1954250 RepID=A0AA40B406_9PEZI|nr:uncharacterized protein B0T26DRAFT_117804 [Lasiosphaeria miniovina]KAK0727112.1 hypothetical protein B0T26DRAFT_117804 [Lasiosphaeria miniovina]